MTSRAARVVQVAQWVSSRVALEPRTTVLEGALVAPLIVFADGSVHRSHVRVLVLKRALHASYRAVVVCAALGTEAAAAAVTQPPLAGDGVEGGPEVSKHPAAAIDALGSLGDPCSVALAATRLAYRGAALSLVGQEVPAIANANAG